MRALVLCGSGRRDGFTSAMCSGAEDVLREAGWEAEVIRRRYGLSGHLPQTQRQVAVAFGISRSYVSRIEKRALAKLEAALTGDSE